MIVPRGNKITSVDIRKGNKSERLISAEKTFPNFRVETCKILSMQNIDSPFKFGNSAKKYQVKTSRETVW